MQAGSPTTPGTEECVGEKMCSSNSSNQHSHVPDLQHHSELGEWGHNTELGVDEGETQSRAVGLWLGLLAAPAALTAVWGRIPDLC